MLLIAVAFAALVRNSGRMLFGAARRDRAAIAVPTTIAAALLVGDRRLDRARDHRGSPDRAVHHRRRPARGLAMSRRSRAAPDLRETAVAGQGRRTLHDRLPAGLVAAHDDGDRLRVVYLFLAGRPDRRVELECIVSASDPAVPSLAYAVLPGQPIRTGDGRPLRDPPDRASADRADWSGTHTGPRTGIRCAQTPGPHRNSQPAGRFPFVTVEGRGGV